jgi:chemotaxis family two-component system response regulator Rcp1
MVERYRKTVEILLVEDSRACTELLREAFKICGYSKGINTVRDGIEALAFLHREGEHADAPRPDLVLLDLNLPRKDGRELLAEIKNDAELQQIPVIILTTSDAPQDIDAAYRLHANGYIVKPFSLKEFYDVVSTINKFWLETVMLPPD